MNLCDLRPTQPTELSLLSNSIRSGSAKAAMPSALPEPFLISVARDLRMLEECEDDELQSSYLSAPMMLVFSLHLGIKKGDTKLTISESVLHRSLTVYQWAVEREIIRRIVGAKEFNDDRTLLECFEQARNSTD